MATNKKLSVLVTGANGQLGSCIREIATSLPHKFIFTDIDDMDITSPDSVEAIFEREKPDWIVNCAAYTAVDKAENDHDTAKLINATAVGILAEQAAKIGAAIVHISTDYVFQGDDPTPRIETDETQPQSVYGQTKLEGEKLAGKNPKHIIIRTSWLYSIYGNNFVKTMRRLGNEKNEIGVVSDQWGSPTSAHDLAKAVVAAVENPEYGLYHFSNEGTTNWALFAEEIMNLSNINCKVNHISTEQYPTPAKRPKYSLMSKEKFKKTFGINIPEWEVSLADVINTLKN